MIQSNALVTSTANSRTKWKADMGGGASGSSYYFCPDGDDAFCDTGDEAMVVVVAAGFNSAEDRHIGPKATAFRSAALSVINN